MITENAYCIIMAGGVGRRFWPYSNESLPKQFLDLLGTGMTLLQQTFYRYKKLLPIENIYVTTLRKYKDIVLHQLPDLDENHIILESERKNTAPSIALAAHIIQRINTDATLIIAPSDHLIIKDDEFKEAMTKGLNFASQEEVLITVGIKPTWPATGYGYLQRGEHKAGDFYKVKTFIEKPELEFAKMFVNSNEFYWNSGIFIWHVQTILKAFREMNTDVFTKLDTEEPDFSGYPNISIDYSILERADNVYVQVCDFGWTDIGNWNALYEVAQKDSDGNVHALNPTMFFDGHNNVVACKGDKLVVVEGLDNYLIAESEHALLICRRDNQEQMRRFLNQVEATLGKKYS